MVDDETDFIIFYHILSHQNLSHNLPSYLTSDRGLTPTLIMAIPNTVIYFACYDIFKFHLESTFINQHHQQHNDDFINQHQQDNDHQIHLISPILSGSAARIVGLR